jgi:hypothetical protein
MYTKQDLLTTVNTDDVVSFEVFPNDNGELTLYIASCNRSRLPEKYWTNEFIFDGTKQENIVFVKSLAEKVKARWLKAIEWDLDGAIRNLENA